LNWDKIIDNDDDDDKWVDPGSPSRPSEGNDSDACESEEEKQGGEKETGQANGTQDGTRNGKWKAAQVGKRKEKRNGKQKGIVTQTLGRDDVSRVVAVRLRKELYEADSDPEC
jgi:hypothetical protein